LDVTFKESWKVGDFHNLGVSVSFSDTDMAVLESGSPNDVRVLRERIDLAVYEGRLAALRAAFRSGVLSKDDFVRLAAEWKP
jgi:hypothetical protein